MARSGSARSRAAAWCGLVAVLAVVPGPASAQERLVVLDRTRSHVLLVDPGTRQVLARIPTGGGPQELVVSPDGRVAYITVHRVTDDSPGRPAGVAVLDLESHEVVDTFRAGTASGPAGIGRSDLGSRIWVTAGEQGEILELDARDGAMLMRWKTGGARSHTLAVTPDGRKLYVTAARSDSVAVIDRLTVAAGRIPTGASPEGLDLAPDGQELWVANRDGHSLTVIDTRRDAVLATVGSGGLEPLRPRFRPDGAEVWVVNRGSASVSVIEREGRSQVWEIALPGAPLDILFSPDGRHAYVSMPEWGEVAVVDVPGRQVLDYIPAGSPGALAWTRLPAPTVLSDPRVVRALDPCRRDGWWREVQTPVRACLGRSSAP